MSVSHPYLKQLKVHVLQFHQHQGQIRDDHPSLLPFCRTLEDILRDGLRGTRSRLTNEVQKTLWQWMLALLKRYSTKKLTGPLQLCIEYAKDNKKAIYAVGKARLAVRCMLNKNLLSNCVKLLREDKVMLLDYYEEISILGDDILSEMLLSLLAPLELRLSFALNLRNASFLDETWDLPWFRRHELVPCKRMGVELQVVEGRIVVMEVEPGSVADEDMKIEPGDILDDLFGESLRQSSIRKVVTLMDDFQGSPIYVSVVKCIHRDGRFYRPIFVYLEGASLCKQAILSNRERRLREMRETGCEWDVTDSATVKSQESGSSSVNGSSSKSKQSEGGSEEGLAPGETTDSGLYRCKLWGFVHVGTVGTVEQIESGVLTVVKRNPDLKRDVLVELGETEVTIFCAEKKTVLLQHGFPEISSCGRRIDYPLNFSYIAGETTCTLAKKFTCFVFEAMSDEQAKAVLKGIADGFDRTHWAV